MCTPAEMERRRGGEKRERWAEGEGDRLRKTENEQEEKDTA